MPCSYHVLRFSPTIEGMSSGRAKLLRAAFTVCFLAAGALAQQIPPAPLAKNARILLLPRKMISGDRATVAVLDVNGRLTPGATIAFSNGDRVTTDATGRGLFVAPLTSGTLYATLQGRPGRVQTQVVPAEQSKSRSTTQVLQAPHFASLTDRFELLGHGFCGDADRNTVQINGRQALVLASSPEALTVLPPAELEPGPADVSISCAKGEAGWTRVIFLALSLEADSSPLRPGEKRTLSVKIEGTTERVMLEARNLAPEVAELAGGASARATSSGGSANAAIFPLTGKARGNILVSIRLLPGAVKP